MREVEAMKMITIPKMARDVALGKVIAILLIGLIVGYALAVSAARDYERGQKLTLEKYTADFEKYRAKLLDRIPVWVSFTFGTLTAVGLFGVYEVIGRAFGRLIGMVSG